MWHILFVRFWYIWIPLALFLLWWSLVGRKKKKADELTRLEEKYWLITLLVSAAALVVTLLWFGLIQEENTNKKYVPAEFIDGQIVPGKFEQKNEGK